MDALLCTAYGRPPLIEPGRVEERALRPEEVRIAVEAVGIGFFDAVLLAGEYQERPEPPFPVGRECAGTVVEIGSAVDPALLNNIVAGLAFDGACAERVALPEAYCLRLPAGTGAALGAAILTSYATALYAFENCAQLKPGEKVLILGAAGTVGTAAIDLVGALGGIAIAAASTEAKRSLARRHGAHATVDTAAPDWRKGLAQEVGPVDVILDLVGGPLAEQAFRCLAPGGRHLVAGFASGEIPRLPLNLCLLKRASAVGVNWGGFMQAEPVGNRALMERLAELLHQAKLRPAAPIVYRPDDLPAVIAGLLDRSNIGKPADVLHHLLGRLFGA